MNILEEIAEKTEERIKREMRCKPLEELEKEAYAMETDTGFPFERAVKEGYKYYNILRCKNNIFNRMLLLFKRFDSFNELYIIPEFDGIEGFYYKFM